MDIDNLMRALFVNQRLQILNLAEKLPSSYVYAWENGVYPTAEDGDYSIPDRPHEPFADYFITSRGQVDEVLDYLDKRWMENDSPSFYEMENHFDGHCERGALKHICRYAYLENMFDDKLWTALLAPGKHPGVQTIIKEYSQNDLYLL